VPEPEPPEPVPAPPVPVLVAPVVPAVAVPVVVPTPGPAVVDPPPFVVVAAPELLRVLLPSSDVQPAHSSRAMKDSNDARINRPREHLGREWESMITSVYAMFKLYTLFRSSLS
jgi:hypothetical protein